MCVDTGENSSPLPLQSEYEQRSTKMSIGEASAETLASIFGSSGQTLRMYLHIDASQYVRLLRSDATYVPTYRR